MRQTLARRVTCEIFLSRKNPTLACDLNNRKRKSGLIPSSIGYQSMQKATQAMDSRDDEFEEPAVRVAEAVAQAKGVDVLDLEPLFETIDSEALNALLVNADRDVEVAFEYEGYAVRIRGDGEISLDA